jgi:predicted transcriptional regulator of viral defense system
MATTGQTADLRLQTLPETFTYSEARRTARLSDRHLSELRRRGLIDTLGRGLYRRNDLPAALTDEPVDIDLLEIAYRAPRATLCLTSALARHNLTDAIPATIDVALPRGRHRPVTRAPVTWHMFDPRVFDVGRERLVLDGGIAIGIYTAERCIIDAFRLSHLEGPELAITALKRWLRRRGSTPASLLEMARAFPKAQRSLRHALVVLL